MAMKTRKTYEYKGKVLAEAEKGKPKDKNAKVPIAEAGINAPIVRRVAANAVDLVLALVATGFFLLAAGVPEVTLTYRFLYLASIVVTQIWLFGLIPTEYWKGQTIGRKIFRLYGRNVQTHLPLSFYQSILRDYIYGVLAGVITIPFEIGHFIFEYLRMKTEVEMTTQMIPCKKTGMILVKDRIFKSEIVYLPKNKTN
ncbi:hypothetical protein AwErysi_03500 [Erysipelotrichaceae bacterium]|nr:hypothetical protein AwErysi_03500 [Erysipelotrichaceae bacterium]